MFESDELTGAQRDTLAYLVILVVAVSLSYFFWILFTELWVAFYPTVPLFCIKPKKTHEQLDTDIEFAEISFERQNPINDEDKEREVTKLQTQLESAETLITQMQSEIGTLKKQRKSENLVTPGMATNIAAKKQKKKTMLSHGEDDDLLLTETK